MASHARLAVLMTLYHGTGVLLNPRNQGEQTGSVFKKELELRENQDGHLVLSDSLKNPVFLVFFFFLVLFFHSFTHHEAFKMTQIINRHQW